MNDLRILYLVPDLYGPPGGIARHGRIVCRALVEAGAHLTVLALHDRAGDAMVEGMAYRGCNGRRRAFVRHALTHARLPLHLVLAEHAHFAAVGHTVSHLTHAPHVAFLHGTEVWERLSPIRRLALQRAHRALAPSAFTANRAAEVNGLSRRRIRVLHHCLDPEFAPHPASDPVDRPSLLTVARVSAAEQYKGHDVVIRALPALLGRFPDLVYDLVGEGDGRPALERLAAELGVAHAVRFHGRVPEQDLASHYARASVFVMPSRREGFGFSFLEAMAYGRPVVAGNGDAAAEVVRHGETGLLIDPADVAAVTGAIARLLDDPVLRQGMGARGAEIVAHDFAFPAFRTRLTAQLTDVLDQAATPGRSRESTRLTQW